MAAPFDRDLTDLTPELRWREWMGRVEAAIFASTVPVPREVLATLVGHACPLDALIQDIRDELRTRPYDLVKVADGWQHRTRPHFITALRAAARPASPVPALSAADATLLMTIAYHQPVTRTELSTVLGKDVSPDAVARLRRQNLVGPGPRSPQPGAPCTYVTTPVFLSRFELESLRDLPDRDRLEAAGLLSKEPALAAVRAPRAGSGDGAAEAAE